MSRCKPPGWAGGVQDLRTDVATACTRFAHVVACINALQDIYYPLQRASRCVAMADSFAGLRVSRWVRRSACKTDGVGRWAHFLPARRPSSRSAPGVKKLCGPRLAHAKEFVHGVFGRELGVGSRPGRPRSAPCWCRCVASPRLRRG